MANFAHMLVTCEHGGNDVPAPYRSFFAGQREVLDSHRGHDAGALGLARAIAGEFDADLHYATTTRLLVELNRSVHNHRSIFSEFTRQLPAAEKKRLLDQHYLPYRNGVEARIRELTDDGSTLHVSIHTFTPVLVGKTRTADIGLLYDPKRQAEKAFCHRWRRALAAQQAGYRVKMNYPYLGYSDGLTTYLRKIFSAKLYLGIELEVNQKHLQRGGGFPESLIELLLKSLRHAMQNENKSNDCE